MIVHRWQKPRQKRYPLVAHEKPTIKPTERLRKKGKRDDIRETEPFKQPRGSKNIDQGGEEIPTRQKHRHEKRNLTAENHNQQKALGTVKAKGSEKSQISSAPPEIPKKSDTKTFSEESEHTESKKAEYIDESRISKLSDRKRSGEDKRHKLTSLEDAATDTTVPEARKGQAPREHAASPSVRGSKQKKGRLPAKYRPPSSTPKPYRRPSIKKDTESSREARARASSLELRILFSRGDECQITLLARRVPSLPEELIAKSRLGDTELVALGDDFYQDILLSDIADVLRNGLVLQHDTSGNEWMLSGREIYLFTSRVGHYGRLSCPRLVIRREHVVLCTKEQLIDVEKILKEIGCAAWEQVEGNGVPEGWILLREVIPMKPLLDEHETELLNFLRPLAEIEIEFEGGVRLIRNEYLFRHPPNIKIYGETEQVGPVLIDGQEAVADGQGSFSATGWEQVGEHSVICGGKSHTYVIRRCEAEWQVWPAYPSPIEGEFKFALCGPLLLVIEEDQQVEGGAGVQVSQNVVGLPESNPVVLGARPGQICIGKPRADLRGGFCLIAPHFEIVWALPRLPLLCDKRSNEVLLIGGPIHPRSARREEVFDPQLSIWCEFILNAGRKGLQIRPHDKPAVDLWRDYKRQARNYWRHLQ